MVKKLTDKDYAIEKRFNDIEAKMTIAFNEIDALRNRIRNLEHDVKGI